MDLVRTQEIVKGNKILTHIEGNENMLQNQINVIYFESTNYKKFYYNLLFSIIKNY